MGRGLGKLGSVLWAADLPFPPQLSSPASTTHMLHSLGHLSPALLHPRGDRSTEIQEKTILHPHPQRLVPSWGQEWERRAGVSYLGILVLPCCLRTCVSASAPAYFP